MHGIWKMLTGEGLRLNRKKKIIEVTHGSAPTQTVPWNGSIDNTNQNPIFHNGHTSNQLAKDQKRK